MVLIPVFCRLQFVGLFGYLKVTRNVSRWPIVTEVPPEKTKSCFFQVKLLSTDCPGSVEAPRGWWSVLTALAELGPREQERSPSPAAWGHREEKESRALFPLPEGAGRRRRAEPRSCSAFPLALRKLGVAGPGGHGRLGRWRLSPPASSVPQTARHGRRRAWRASLTGDGRGPRTGYLQR